MNKYSIPGIPKLSFICDSCEVVKHIRELASQDTGFKICVACDEREQAYQELFYDLYSDCNGSIIDF